MTDDDDSPGPLTFAEVAGCVQLMFELYSQGVGRRRVRLDVSEYLDEDERIVIYDAQVVLGGIHMGDAIVVVMGRTTLARAREKFTVDPRMPASDQLIARALVEFQCQREPALRALWGW